MIMINLVRYGRRKKMKTFRKRSFIYFLYLFSLVLSFYYAGSLFDGYKGSYEKVLSEKRNELNKKLKLVKKGSRLKKSFRDKALKLNEIERITERNKILMDLIKYVAEASALSNIRLSSFSVTSDSLEIEGFGFNTRVISDFIGRLKSSRMVKTAGLKTVDKNCPDGYPKLRFLVICTRKT